MKENQIRELVNELRDIAIEYHGTQQLRERIARTVRAALHHDLEKLNQPVSQTYELPELIEGMEVSVDVSTCDFDAGHRYFGTVTEVSVLDTAKNGYILLVQDAKPNFDVNGNSPVSPGGWISCSERMPEQGAYISAVSKHGEYVAGQVIDDWLDLHDGTSFGLDEVYLWMMLPPLPASPQQ
ncbi:DUF551 domain-containing protein [Salmonella enterica subsp. enterica]|uniref:DUF551 domain-containing protein n=3 Tax=Salmonella enterica TaxID=28901 RepID=A0A622CZ14_SALER|nr:DUF551 domain-containing protein [Salmonella enterica]EAB7821480.1 DUF551 domain-containing protein [Salmonella enterica subsp. enterica]EBG0233222.1 DUF551 domain-containing protein [Salmonella enterica subsp. enterica serovar Monschaui]EDV2816992.1 DUF551 domain-containing protein [Salmonella enterica subsp. enterica serovar Ealing]HBJ6907546.1 DUF551 domain-containing protein [Salmonella enterica subsp. enterica serovar Widemarsh]EAM5576743.1 DUF551 domain-containing protein [Salmonella 